MPGQIPNANGMGSMSQLHAAANDGPSPNDLRRPGDPVEFNHAISYVNKIKTRFAAQPDIYKTFLEILQTYQREQLRISDVYAQVTGLFQDAPDLLEDFKQFLPDITQQQPEAVNEGVRLPPFGKFDPPSGVAQTQPPAAASGPALTQTGRKKGQEVMVFGQPQPYEIQQSNLRGTPKASKDGAVQSGLTPAVPEPQSADDPAALTEEIAFFDRAKKHIANKQTYNEFLKVLNLFSQRIIDKNVLVDRVEGFLSGNKELMDWFKAFVKYDGKPLSILNIPYKKHLLELNLCKSYGKSYRKLPKSETYMPCSGRDEMCWEVLNDEWVGHPTWASEEAGFVAHRKNQYEEIMHRVEEERLEYDYFIEANLRSIQTLETIASRIANMTAEEKSFFKLPPNLGYTSTIHEKVLKKIYGEARYHEVIDALRENPALSVPVILKRLKQKDEEWKRAHREWNKVWRDTEQKVFYKSLDHRGLTFKQTDKKYIAPRQLVSEIMTVKVEQSNKRLDLLTPQPQEQLSYFFKSTAIVGDMSRIILRFLDHSTYSTNDKEKIESFFSTFVKLFFSIENDDIKQEKDTEKASDETAPVTNGSKRPRDELKTLREILKKSKFAKVDDASEVPSERNGDPLKEIEKSGELWLKHVDSEESAAFKNSLRESYNLFANTTIYVFVRLLVIFYERLNEVKSFEEDVSKELASSRTVQFAIDLDLYDHRMEDLNLQFKSENCYEQLLALIERLLEGNLEHQLYEEAIRQAYRNRAYKLYTVDKLVQSLVKHIHTILTDAKSSDALVLFEQDREKPTSSAKDQILYRMKTKSVLGADENMFRIEWNNRAKQLRLQFLGQDDLTLEQTRSEEEKWNYYMTSYLMSSPTEGVPADNISLPFMSRTLADKADSNLVGVVEQGLAARVSSSTYRLFFEPGTEDFYSRGVPASGEPSTAGKEQHQKRWTKFLNGKHGWTVGLGDKDRAEGQGKFEAWKTKGPEALSSWQAAPEAEQEQPEKNEKENEGVSVSVEGGKAPLAEAAADAPKTSEAESQPAAAAAAPGLTEQPANEADKSEEPPKPQQQPEPQAPSEVVKDKDGDVEMSG